MVKLWMDATIENMIEILCVGDYAEDIGLVDMTDDELIEEGIKRGCWNRCGE